MAYVTFANALLQTVGGDVADYDDLAQAALEISTVSGYGAINSFEEGNQDQGDYLAVVMYPMGSQLYPVTVHFSMSGPQGSLGPITITDPFMVTRPLTMDDLVAHGWWSISKPY